MQLGLNGAAIRQHMRKIFNIVTHRYTRVRAKVREEEQAAPEKGSEIRCDGPGFFSRTSGAPEGQNH